MATTNSSDIVENFYGVYLLYCENPKFKGRTYIGFTVDPNRRIKQHNNGVKCGGANRTNNKGPWEMVLIVHGFPSDISALRFEWAWQNPHKSKRLRLIQPKKKAKQSKFEYCLHILALMFQTRPWSRLPLTLRWLKQEYFQDFPPGMEPPMHIPVVFGAVKPMKVKQDSDKDNDDTIDILIACSICKLKAKKNSLLKCLSQTCSMTAHVACLAKNMLKRDPSNIIPIEGPCPKCEVSLLWGNIVRLKKGCYQEKFCSNEENDHWTQSLTQRK